MTDTEKKFPFKLSKSNHNRQNEFMKVQSSLENIEGFTK